MRIIADRVGHRKRLQVLRAMSPEKRLLIALDLSDFARRLFAEGLRRRFPYLDEARFRNLFIERLEKCHNRNY